MDTEKIANVKNISKQFSRATFVSGQFKPAAFELDQIVERGQDPICVVVGNIKTSAVLNLNELYYTHYSILLLLAKYNGSVEILSK